jgi:DnaJ-domain-containing protein 1
MAVWNRSRRSDGDKQGVADPEFVSLSDEDHAWWAAREELERAWAPAARPVDDGEGGDDKPHNLSEFQKKFSSESLFDWAEGTDTFTDGEPELPRAPDDPFGVLGVPSTATWDEVVAAHRQLAKQHHPDRLQEAGDDQRAESENTMRQVNAAYRELRERFRPS